MLVINIRKMLISSLSAPLHHVQLELTNTSSRSLSERQIHMFIDFGNIIRVEAVRAELFRIVPVQRVCVQRLHRDYHLHALVDRDVRIRDGIGLLAFTHQVAERRENSHAFAETQSHIR